MLTGTGLMLELGAPQELRAAAQHGLNGGLRANAHMHLPPNFSAFRDTREAVELAAAQDIGVLGANNYYDYHVYNEFAELASERGIFPLFGMELIAKIDSLLQAGVKLNDPGNPGKMYICGKGIGRYEPKTTEAGRLLGNMRAADMRRADEMLRRACAWLAEQGLAISLTLEAVIEMIVAAHGTPRCWVFVQERHVAQALQQAVFAAVAEAQRADVFAKIFEAPPAASNDAAAMQNLIRARLLKSGKPAFVEESFLGLAEGMRLILELGGVPCYPVLADGVAPVCGFEATPAQLTENLQKYGFTWAEFIPLRNKAAVLEDYVTTLRAAGLVITAGTEHNTLDKIAIEPRCLDGAPVPEVARKIFWEGACVAAAHQYLCAHGEAGYVDPEGRLNANYPDHEARIAEFKRLGEAVILRFREKFGHN